MKHLLNICNINGAEVEPVDVIIGGSPCQDLSVAGKRAGLDGERSGLFMEQIRIIKETRDADKLRHTDAVSADCGEGGTTTIESGITQHGLCGANQHVRPRYMVWENVPGAFSSNKGEDFRIVLEETAKIADEAAVIPQPDKGKWTNAGAIMGDGWSIAWRVFDAQFWGVPQRRRRIALVADFGGQSAPEILFKSDSMSGDIAESGAEGQGVAGDAERSTDAAVGFDSYNQVTYSECSQTLKAEQGGDSVAKVIVSKACYQNGQGDCFENDVTCAIATNSNPSGRNVPLITESVCMPINTQVITRHNALGNGTGFGLGKDGDPAYTIQAGHEHGVAVFSFDSLSSNSMKSSNPHSGCRQVEIAKCIDTTNPDPSKNQGGMAVVHDARGNGYGSIAPTMTGDHNGHISDYTSIVAYQSVRRLTPLECERLQGYEDNWTNIPPQTEVTAEDLSFWRTVWEEWDDMNGKKRHTDKQIVKWLQSEPSDSARYKALGNSIALPPWRFVLSRIHNQGARTMASLFDGIGGFPKIWQELGGQTLWCSEVEPFPIAVTRYHFKEAQNA